MKSGFARILFFGISLLLSIGTQAQFITTWKTDNFGTSNNDQITIPTFSGETYSYNVDWGDGNSDTGVTGNITHTYSTSGTYTVSISGTFPRIYFNDGGDRRKLLSVEQWGNIAWTSMEDAFEGCTQMVVNASDAPDLSGVTSMRGMFREALKFNSDISSWDVSNVTDMARLFDFCESFDQPLNSWNVSNVANMDGMFEDCKVFNQPLDNWDVSNVTRMFAMFLDAESFNQPINSWNVSNVTIMEDMFFFATAFNQPLNNWDVSNVTSMRRMFDLAESFNQDISGWNVNSVTNMFSMFAGAKAFNQDITGWDISNVTNMGSMFSGASAFNQNVGLWDISIVIQISSMFNNATAFNQDISGWDISGILDLRNLFRGAENFNQDISGWDVSGVTGMDGMFENTKAFNADISGWNVSSVIDMAGMFSNAEAFDQDLSGWDVSSVRFMENMFAGKANVNFDITGWDVSSVQNMDGMFSGNETFNQDISGWNVSSVRFMRSMFNRASSFDQDLGGWNVGQLDRADFMFDSAGLSIANYDNLLIGWASQTLQNNVTLGAQFINYCEGDLARQSIISTYGWILNDEGLGCIFVYEGDDTTGPQIFSGQATAIDFGNTPVGSGKTKNFTIESNLPVDITNLNITTSGSDFSTSPLFFTIAPGNTLTFGVTLEGLTIGTFTETVSISADNFPSPFEFNVTGEVTPGPEPEIRVFSSIPFELIPDGSTTPYDFGTTLKGTDAVRSFEIENIGSADLDISTLFTVSSSYSIDNSGPITIPPDGIVTVNITLNSSAEGSFNDLVSFENNDTDESTYTFEVDGFVDGPVISVFDESTELFGGETIDFGNGLLGSDLDRDITVRNSGPVELVINDISISGTAFTFVPTVPLTIPENDPETGSNPEQIFTFRLSGGSPGSFSETVTIANSDDDNPSFTFEVTGTVSGSTGPEIAVFGGSTTGSPEIVDGQTSAVDIGSVEVGNDIDFTFTIENTGGTDLMITNIVAAGTGFSIGSLPSSVLSGSTEQFTVRLSGAAEGVFNGTVTIVSDDADEGNFDFPIVGEILSAAAPEIAVYDGPDSNSPELTTGQNTIDFGTTDQGIDVDREFTIRNQGTADLNITSISSSGSAFEIVSPPTIITAGSEETFTVGLSSTNPGSFNEDLTIQNDDNNEGSFTISFTGTVLVPGNEAPTISSIEDVVINEDGATSAVPFIIDDAESDPSSLSVTVSSNNQSLIPDSQISISGTAPDFSIVATPLPDQNGTAIITLTVSDGVNTTTETFIITVSAVNDIPIITGQNPLSTPKNTSLTLDITDFTASDPDNSFPTDFTLIVDNGGAYTVDGTTITPATDFAGLLFVPVFINDGNDNSPAFEAEVSVTEIELDLIVDGESKSEGDDIVFPDVLVGSSSIEEVVITNSGNIDLVISEILIEGPEFRLISPIPAPIQPGGLASLEIEFAPTSIGPKQALMTIVSNAPEQFLVTLSSNGLSEIPEIEVYNVVSTNNDGKNDYFQIRNIEFYPDNQLIIYNRWGSEVFRVNNYSNTNNTFVGVANNGKRLPDGTYYYILELKSEDDVKKGYLLLSE